MTVDHAGSNPRQALRAAIEADELLVLPGAYDALSATLVESGGFAGAYMTGAGVSMSLIGHPDLGFTTMTEMAAQVARITSVIDIPLVADADTGFGNPLNVQRTVRAYERAGVSGMHIEDQDFPKRCGHLDGKIVIPKGEFIEKVHAAVEARTDPEMVLIARTDARGPLGFDEAIERTNAYAAAGADLIFVEAPQSEDEIARIPKEVSGPVMYNLVTHGHSPLVSTEQLADWGYAMAIIPGALITPVVEVIRATLAALGAPTPQQDAVVSPQTLFDAVGYTEWMRRSDRFAPPQGSAVVAGSEGEAR
jgi:2-methylisocitrate lyase-like PEP mutase family enzyme